MKLRFTPRAAQDLADIADYIHQRTRRPRFTCVQPFLNHSSTLFYFRILGGDNVLPACASW
jgi:hypothetical protein